MYFQITNKYLDKWNPTESKINNEFNRIAMCYYIPTEPEKPQSNNYRTLRIIGLNLKFNSIGHANNLNAHV